MKRRHFLASLIAVPAGVIAAVKVAARPPPPDLDEIFNALYALKRERDNRDVGHVDLWVGDAETRRQIEKAFAKFYQQRYGVT